MAWLTDRRLLAGAVLGWFVVTLLAVLFGPPLGHDESAFALIARGDAPAWLYRSRGVVALDALGVAAGGSELALRAPFLLVGTGLVLAVFAVGRAAFDARTGAWAAAVIAGAHPMVLRGAEAIGDVPAAASLLAGLAIAIGELSRDGGPRWRFVLVAPCFAAAFYFRYGSAPVVGLAAVTAAALWWRAIVRRPGPVLAAAAVFALLLVPHVVHSIDRTGTWLGVLEVSRKMPRRAYVGEGLVTYLSSNPFVFYGALVAPVMLAGAATAWQGGRAAWLLLVVALGQIVSLGLQSHGQPRYVFVAVALLVVLGVRGLRAVELPRAAFALVALAWLGVAIAVVPLQRSIAHARAPLVAAGEAIRADAAGRPCLVAATAVAQLMWYAGCAGTAAAFDEPWPAGRIPYAVSLPGQRLDLAVLAARRQLTVQPLAARDPRTRVGRLQ